MKILILQDKAGYYQGRDWPRGVRTRGLQSNTQRAAHMTYKWSISRYGLPGQSAAKETTQPSTCPMPSSRAIRRAAARQIGVPDTDGRGTASRPRTSHEWMMPTPQILRQNQCDRTVRQAARATTAACWWRWSSVTICDTRSGGAHASRAEGPYRSIIPVVLAILSASRSRPVALGRLCGEDH